MTLALDLECRALTKKFGHFTAVDNVSFSIPSGSFFSILGPSGCGKTTLLRMLAGFIEPTSGALDIKGKSMLGVPPNKRPVNMVFQHLALFPMMTVGENIAYGLACQKVSKSETQEKVRAVLDRVNLSDAIDKKPSQLSGGQKQRIAIARCLVLEPDVLLLDEPLGALDLKLREHMKVELKQLQDQFGTTFVYITHDQSEALVMSDQVAVMNKGRFEQIGTPQELYYHAKTDFVASFVGDSNKWHARIIQQQNDQYQLTTDDGFHFIARSGTGETLSPKTQVDVYVRPEAIVLSKDTLTEGSFDNILHGKVNYVLFNGGSSRVLVQDIKSNHLIDVNLPQTGEFHDLQEGQQICLGWQADQTKCFLSQNHVLEA